MGPPSRLIGLALVVCGSGLTATLAAAQVAVLPASDFTSHARYADRSATTGVIAGKVLDDRGKPLDGVVVSALGGSTAFAVSDRAGQFALQSLTPGPYLVRAHLDGYLPRAAR